MKPIIFYDLECTGADKDTNKIRIIEISAKKVNAETLEVIDTLYERCNNGDVPIAPDATARHGIYAEDLVGYPTFDDVAEKVFKFFEGCDLGGYYNTFYDNPILYMSFMRKGLKWDFRSLKVYDVYMLYKKYNTGKLGDVYKKYTGKDMQHAHEADADINATIEIYKEQLKRGEVFAEDELDVYKNNVDIAGNFKIRQREDGVREVYINFPGKWNGKSVDEVDISYLRWICDSEDRFPIDTRSVARKILNARA